jgi:DNA-binding winged helix-turn-helix (wHTH) protein
MRLRFADCVIDTELRALTRSGRPVPLPPRTFRLLEVLAERRPRPVTHRELRALLWADTLAGGTRLARVVNEARTAIGDQGRSGQLIRTVHRFGYAFCAEAIEERAEAEEPTSYALQWGVRLVPLAAGENVIGRDPRALISLASRDVSRRHARIVVADGHVVLEDLGSRNGTCLGEARITGPVPLQNGDRIGVGPVLLIFRTLTAEETASAHARS